VGRASLTHCCGLPSASSRARPIRQVWAAPVFSDRTSVGLDVHARSAVAAAIDGVTCGVFRARLTPAHEDVLGWVRGLPSRVRLRYEAGLTGLCLYRALPDARVPPCGGAQHTTRREITVLAPSDLDLYQVAVPLVTDLRWLIVSLMFEAGRAPTVRLTATPQTGISREATIPFARAPLVTQVDYWTRGCPATTIAS
jgi:hypothetical protein